MIREKLEAREITSKKRKAGSKGNTANNGNARFKGNNGKIKTKSGS